MLSINYLIIIATVATSIWAWKDSSITDELIFYPYRIKRFRYIHSFVTSGFIHADFWHLMFNMLTLFFFGRYVEESFIINFNQQLGKSLYLILYFSALIISILPTYFQNYRNEYYQCLGASGAVSAVVFAGILLNPTMKIGIFIIPPIIPGYIFAPIYLFITAYLSKNKESGINHSAHLWGSLFGVIYVFLIFWEILGINIFKFILKNIISF